MGNFGDVKGSRTGGGLEPRRKPTVAGESLGDVQERIE